MPANSYAATNTSSVFLIDDFEPVRISFKNVLEADGIPVRAYAGGADFLADCAPDQRGCVVMYSAMPGMDGSQVLRAMRARGFQMPVILMVSRRVEGGDQLTSATGYFAVLQKPVTLERLLATVRAGLEEDSKRVASGS